MANDDRPSRKVKDDGNTKSKKKDASPASISGSADASGLRRSGRETPSRKQTTTSPSNTRKSQRIEKRTPPSTPPIKKKLERIEKQMEASPLRRSDRGKKHFSPGSSGSKKSAEVPASSNIKSKKEKIASSSKQSAVDVSEDNKNERQDPDVGGRKRKRMSARDYKALFKPQRIRIEADDDKDPEGQDKSPQANASSNGDVDKDLKRPDKLPRLDNNKNGCSLEDRDDGVGKCSDRADEKCFLKGAERPCGTSYSSLKNLDVEEVDDQFVAEESDCKRRISSKEGHKVSLNSRTVKGAPDKAQKVLLDERLMDLDQVEHVGCPQTKPLDGKSTESGYAEKQIGGKCSSSNRNMLTGNMNFDACADSDNHISHTSPSSGCKKHDYDETCLTCLKEQRINHDSENQQELDSNDKTCDRDLYGTSSSKTVKWNKAWTVPHQLLKKRLLLSFKPLNENQENAGKVLNYHYEWLVKWQGLDYGQATWELESASVLGSPKGQNLIKEYENYHGKAGIFASMVDKTKEPSVKPPTIPAGGPLGMDQIHLSYVKKLHDSWTKGQSRVVFDNQERVMRVVLFILSLKSVTQPFLMITTSGSLSQWEAMFLRLAPSNDFKVSIEDRETQRSVRLLEAQKEGGRLVFQVLLYPVDAFVEDLHVLKNINWEAIMVDECQCSEISTHFNDIKSLSTDKRLLLFGGSLGESMAEYINVLSLLGSDGALSNNTRSKTESDDSLGKLKETLSRYIAYECKSDSSKFVEFWVPVQISNLQLEQYCATLLSNAMALRSCSKSDTVGALHDILISNRKCCDHPYIVDPLLQSLIMKDLEPTMLLDVGIKASGKLQFLDLILPEVKKRQLRVLILYQPMGGIRRGFASVGDILDDFVHQRFGQDSYERVDGVGIVPSKKQAALNNFNKDMSRFIFLLEYRACLPSIKLSSVDIIVIFDSDLNPANDLRALQKISIDSQSEQIMIFRLYSSCTLEEKILRLAEHNVAIDSKLQNLSRSTCDALLTWGASDLFNKLNEFHSASVLNISSEESFLKDVLEEFLCLISHKCKSKDTAKSIITRVQSSGTYGKNLPLHSETKTQLPDGEPPHIFWRKLLEGRYPRWKFVSVSTPRQRKRPHYFEDSSKETSAGDADVGKKRKKTVNNSIEPAASKPVIEGETRGANEGASGVPAHNESQSSSGDCFWSTAVRNERSLHYLLKPTVSELCKVLKFSEDVKIIVERFLEFVLENYHVSKEHTSTLQAFMISLCWIGSSLSKYKIDRRESFALAKKHLNFSCMEEEANSVYSKLEPAKEMFLRHTENQEKRDALKDCIPTPQATCTEPIEPRMSHSVPLNPQGVKPETVECQHNQNVDVERIFLEHGQSENHELSNEETLQSTEQMPNKSKKQTENLARKNQKEIDKFNREWDEKRVHLENDYKVDKALIRTLHSNPSVRSEKLKSLDKEFANKLEENERMREIHLKDLMATQLAAEGQMAANRSSSFSEGRAYNELPLHGSQHENQMVHSGGSRQGVQDSPKAAPTSSGNLIEVQSHDKGVHDMHPTLVIPSDIDVPILNVMVGSSIRTETSISLENPNGGSDKVNAMSLELVGARTEDQPKRGGSLGTGTNNVMANGMLFEEGPGTTTAEPPNIAGNSRDGANNIESTGSHTSERQMADATVSSVPIGEIPAQQHDGIDNNVAGHVDSLDSGVPEVDSNKENAEGGTSSPGASHVVEDRNETGPTDMALHVDAAGMGMPAANCNKENAEDSIDNNVAGHVDSQESGMPEVDSNKENAEGGTSSPDASHAVEDRNETGPTDMALHVDAAGMGMPAANCSKENAEDSIDNNVAGHVDSLESGVPEVDSNKENAEGGTSSPDASHAVEDRNKTGPTDMALNVDAAGMGMPAANCNKENAEDSTISPDTSRAVEGQNDSCGSSSSNSPSAAASQEKTPSVHLIGSPASDHSMPTILEIQNESLQLQQLPYSGTQDKDGQASLAGIDDDNLQPVDAGQVGQINSEDSSFEPHDESSFPLSTNPPIAENQSDILPASGILLETTCEEPTLTCFSGGPSQSAENHANPSDHTMLQSRGNLEEHTLVAAETPLGEHQPHLPSSDAVHDQPSVGLHNSAQNPEAPAPPLTAEIPNQNASRPELNMFDVQGSDNHNQAASRMPNQADPLQAELERLCAVKDNVIKFHEDTKQRLKSECEKEIAEMIAQINLKYEAKRQDAESAFHLKKKELDINLNRVVMNKILAEAFRSKCQDLTPSGHAGMQQVSQAGLMQQLHRFSVLPSMRRSLGVASSSPGQSSGSQQITPPPPPLQIVHQPAALFSSTPSRPPPNTDLRSPSSTPSRPPPSINPVTPNSMSSRPLPNINPIIPSSSPSRPPPCVNPITPSSTPCRPPPGINPITPSSMPNRPPPSINPITPSAGNLRVNSETRAPAPHIRPLVNSEIRAPAPHIRPLVSSEIRAPAPHIRPFRPSASVSHDFASYRRMLPSQHVTSSLPLTSPSNSQAPALPPLSTSSVQPLAPRPPEASTVPPAPASAQAPPSASSWLPSRSQSPQPPLSQASPQSTAPPSLLVRHSALTSQQHPPSSLPATSSSLPHSSSQTPLPRIPSIPTSQNGLFSASPRPESGGPPLPPDNLNLLMDIDARWHQRNILPPPPNLSSIIDSVDLTEFARDGSAHYSSGHDLVCLSDDD